MGRSYTAYKVAMSAPDDVSGLRQLIEKKLFSADDIVCLIGKTEGNGRVNDFSRPLAHRCARDLLCAYTGLSPDETDQKVAFVMSGGCEGIISPHMTIFVSKETPSTTGSSGNKRLAFAMANTRELLPEEIGTITQVALVAEAVRTARERAAIELADVHYVQVKCPLLTTERINAAKSRGKKTVTEDTLRSMGFSNGASGLGIALGLGEIQNVRPEDICSNENIYTTRGGSSSGIELMNCQVFVFGNSADSESTQVSAHCALNDLIDAEGVRQALRNAGLRLDGSLSPGERNKLINAFAKGQVPLDGMLRGWRTTLLTDSDLNTRPARAVLGAVVAAVTGDPAVYASAGWGYHQGPSGGGVVAVIAQTDPV